ncbi:MAG: hypothetical protein NC355_07660 [Blautia sp.]|nr:hypothetical protein [Blautia sp.]
MKKRILEYRRRIDALLAENPADADWNAVLEEHLIQVAFFQHERLIHLMVTLAFAIFTLITVFAVFLTESIGAAVLTLLLLVLLVPYVMHYYLLENEVQKMYAQYDEIIKHVQS